jgi:hypothetical protein
VGIGNLVLLHGSTYVPPFIFLYLSSLGHEVLGKINTKKCRSSTISTFCTFTAFLHFYNHHTNYKHRFVYTTLTMPRYNTRSTAANCDSAAAVPKVVPAPGTLAPQPPALSQTYAAVVAAAPAHTAAPAPIAAPPSTAAPAPNTIPTNIVIDCDAATAYPVGPTPNDITTGTLKATYAAVVAEAKVLPNSSPLECAPAKNAASNSTTNVITPTNGTGSIVPGPPSPMDVLLDAVLLSSAPSAPDDDTTAENQLFASQLFADEPPLPSFAIDNFQPDMVKNVGVKSKGENDDASVSSDDLPLLERQDNDDDNPDDAVIDLAMAADHTNTVDLTDGARFTLGTTNHTWKYTTRKKALLSEFVSVLKSNKEKYERFLVLTSDVVPSTFPSAEPVEMVFILLRGEENKTDKIRSLNVMLIDWVESKRLKVPQKNGNVFPAPSSLNTMVPTFLASTKDYYQWSFSQKDFGYDGGYNGFFAALCETRRKLDVSNELFCYNVFCFN